MFCIVNFNSNEEHGEDIIIVREIRFIWKMYHKKIVVHTLVHIYMGWQIHSIKVEQIVSYYFSTLILFYEIVVMYKSELLFLIFIRE